MLEADSSPSFSSPLASIYIPFDDFLDFDPCGSLDNKVALVESSGTLQPGIDVDADLPPLSDLPATQPHQLRTLSDMPNNAQFQNTDPLSAQEPLLNTDSSSHITLSNQTARDIHNVPVEVLPVTNHVESGAIISNFSPASMPSLNHGPDHSNNNSTPFPASNGVQSVLVVSSQQSQISSGKIPAPSFQPSLPNDTCQDMAQQYLHQHVFDGSGDLTPKIATQVAIKYLEEQGYQFTQSQNSGGRNLASGFQLDLPDDLYQTMAQEYLQHVGFNGSGNLALPIAKKMALEYLKNQGFHLKETQTSSPSSSAHQQQQVMQSPNPLSGNEPAVPHPPQQSQAVPSVPSQDIGAYLGNCFGSSFEDLGINSAQSAGALDGVALQNTYPDVGKCLLGLDDFSPSGSHD